MYHPRVDIIKHRKAKEAEEIKKRWQEYTELHNKGLYGTNCYDVATHLEPDILR